MECSKRHSGGDYPITVRVTDDGNPSLFDTKTFAVTVLAGNRPPILDAIPSQQVNEESELVFQASAIDPDVPADTLTYSLDEAPTGATINPSTGTFRWTPTEADGPGMKNVTLRVADGKGGSDTESFTITVNEVNRPPILQSIPSVQRDVGTSYTFTASATDPTFQRIPYDSASMPDFPRCIY